MPLAPAHSEDAKPLLFDPPKPDAPAASPKAKRRSLQREVATILTDAGVPFVNVDEAKRVLFTAAKLKAFHFVVYQQKGNNWLLWCGEPSKAVRGDMIEWAKVFGDGYAVVYARRRVGGIVFMDDQGKKIELRK